MDANIKKQNGFTIIELIISIFILSVAVVGVFSAFSMITILTSDTTDRLSATYLAQEGMEITRNIRDTNWLIMDNAGCASSADCPASWVDGLNCFNGCEAYYKTGTSMSYVMTQWPVGGNYLYLNNTTGFYDYNQSENGIKTKFKRKIKIETVKDVDDNSDHIIKVTVQVSWDKKATVLGEGVLAGHCCPDQNDPNCPEKVSNCIIAEGTLYDWYNYAHH